MALVSARSGTSRACSAATTLVPQMVRAAAIHFLWPLKVDSSDAPSLCILPRLPLAPSTVPTLLGDTLRVSADRDGVVAVNGTTLDSADVLAQNGPYLLPSLF